MELNQLYKDNLEGEEGTGEISGQIQEFMKETKDQLRLVKDKLLSNQEKISDIETKVVLIVEHA